MYLFNFVFVFIFVTFTYLPRRIVRKLLTGVQQVKTMGNTAEKLHGKIRELGLASCRPGVSQASQVVSVFLCFCDEIGTTVQTSSESGGVSVLDYCICAYRLCH